MSDVASLTTALASAKAAYKANKADKSLKTAMKAAKAALAEGEAAAAAKALKKSKKKSKKNKRDETAEVEEPVTKKQKVAEVSLEDQCAAAKAAYKANKDDKSLKKAWKELKAKMEAAPAAPAAAVEEPKAEEPVLMKSNNKAAAAPAATGAPAGAAYNNGSDGSNPPSAKVFVGNLPWSVDEDFMKDYFKECGGIENIAWVEDKETGRFKGCGFLVFDSTEAATAACAMNGKDCGGREIRINFAKDKNNAPRKEGGAAGGRFANKPLSEKPEGCVGVFVGNLSFDIDDDAMHTFAKDAGCGEVAKIRWLTDRETGDFKGCGFIDFYDGKDVDAFVKKNGESLMGRNIRIDYATPRANR